MREIYLTTNLENSMDRYSGAAQQMGANQLNAPQPKQPRFEQIHGELERVAKQLDSALNALNDRIDQLGGTEPSEVAGNAAQAPQSANIAARIEQTVREIDAMANRLGYAVSRLQRL